MVVEGHDPAAEQDSDKGAKADANDPVGKEQADAQCQYDADGVAEVFCQTGGDVARCPPRR